jgi:hypothetical protein
MYSPAKPTLPVTNSGTGVPVQPTRNNSELMQGDSVSCGSSNPARAVRALGSTEWETVSLSALLLPVRIFCSLARTVTTLRPLQEMRDDQEYKTAAQAAQARMAQRKGILRRHLEKIDWWSASYHRQPIYAYLSKLQQPLVQKTKKIIKRRSNLLEKDIMPFKNTNTQHCFASVITDESGPNSQKGKKEKKKQTLRP